MMTGEQYRTSLRDGRATYFEGERIDDVTSHPMLGQTVDSAAAGYDRFYDPTPDAVAAFMMVPSDAAELREQVELHETVDLLTHVTYASIDMDMDMDMDKAKTEALRLARMEECLQAG